MAVLAGCAHEPDTETVVLERGSYSSFDGQTLSYLDAGDGPVVVLFHGLTSSAQSNYFSTPIAARLQSAGYRVVAADLRGHGGSRVENTAANWPEDALARDAAALIEGLDTPPTAVVGYSMGALTALRLQATGGHDAPLLALGGMGDKTAVIGDRARHDGLDALLLGVADGREGPVLDRVRQLLKASGNDAESVRGSLRHRMTVSRSEVAAMDMPVLVLSGADDFDNGDGAALAGMFPKAEFRTVEGNHLSAPSNPDYADALVEWLDAQLGR